MGETKYFLEDVDKLIPYARNARTHSEVQMPRLRQALRSSVFYRRSSFQRTTPSCVDMEDIMLLRSWGLKRSHASRKNI